MPAHRTTVLDLTPAQRRCVDALDAHKGNRAAAADALGMDQRSFRRRLAEAQDRGAELPEPADTAPVRKPRRIDVKLADLVLSRDLQPRVTLDDATVAEYAALYRDRGPTAMDPVRAFARDDGAPILTRGFTRVAAAKVAGLDTLPCDLYAQPEDDTAMLLDSLSGNRHGLRLTNADKRRALKLYHERIAKRRWDSTRDVAALLGCSHELVAAFRKELTAPAKPAAAAPPAAKPAQASAPAAQPSVSINSPGDLEPGWKPSEEAAYAAGPEEVNIAAGKAADPQLTVEQVQARLAAAIQADGVSAAAYAKKHNLPYLPLVQLLNAGVPSSDGAYGSMYDHALTLPGPASATPATAPAAADPPAAQPEPKPRTLAERRLERERELVCARILEQPGNLAPGSHRELALLLLIVGIDSDPEAVWNDDELSDAEARWDAALAARVTTEIRAGHPRLPDLATIARLWQLDPDAIRIQAQRAVPS